MKSCNLWDNISVNVIPSQLLLESQQNLYLNLYLNLKLNKRVN